MLCRKEGGIPILRPIAGKPAMIGQHDERRQIVIHAAKAVADPATHTRKSRHLKSRGLQIGSLTMHSRLADHVVNEGDVVYDPAEVCDDFAEEFATLAIRLKFPHWFQPRTKSVLKRFDVLAKIRFLPMPFDQFRFEIKQVDMAGSPGHEQLDDALGLRREVRKPVYYFALAACFANQKTGEGNAAKPAAGAPKEITTR